jgi:hypothetical protein
LCEEVIKGNIGLYVVHVPRQVPHTSVMHVATSGSSRNRGPIDSPPGGDSREEVFHPLDGCLGVLHGPLVREKMLDEERPGILGSLMDGGKVLGLV